MKKILEKNHVKVGARVEVALDHRVNVVFQKMLVKVELGPYHQGATTAGNAPSHRVGTGVNMMLDMLASTIRDIDAQYHRYTWTAIEACVA